MNTPTTVTTLRDFYTMVAEHYSEQPPNNKETLIYKCDKRRRGYNTTLSARHLNVQFNHSLLSDEMHVAFRSYRNGCYTLTELMKVLDRVYPTIRSEVAEIPIVEEPVPVATIQASVVTMYDMYECLRNQLSTTAAYQPLYINGEAILPSSLVMLLEDNDTTLEARYEAARCPQPVATPTMNTKKQSKYDRAEIVRIAHQHAKVLGDGDYRRRFSRGMKAAWKAAKEAVVTSATYQSVYLFTNYISVHETRMAKRMLSKPCSVNFNFSYY